MATEPRGVASALKEPEEVSRILRQEYYGRPLAPGPAPMPAPARGRGTPPPATKPKPEHYKIVCISLYREDLEHVDGLVRALKDRGHTKANRSSVIRFALQSVDVSKMPKAY
ncbi:MAG: hypothetical protein HYY06_26050 [Deltaproteobacteria bacterium]|nr:hypothetical protein [Deltaproteobacteria bacterium]